MKTSLAILFIVPILVILLLFKLVRYKRERVELSQYYVGRGGKLYKKEWGKRIRIHYEEM